MLDTLLAGVIHGNTYALVAVGLSLIFGITHLVNFAQGSVFAIGSMTGWWLVAEAHWSLWAAMAGVALVTGLLGLAINVFAVRPLRKAPPISALLATVAVSLVLDNLSQHLFGPETRPFPKALATSNFQLGGLRFGTLDVVMLAVTLGCMIALGGFLKFTKAGRALRAASQDSDAALQMGIPVARMQNIAFVIASALGGLAGVLVGMYNSNISPTAGAQAGLTAFVAATLGGLGSMVGAVVGGVALGIVQAFGISLWGDGVSDLIVFGVLIAVLWVRPAGLFGRVPLVSSEPMTGTFLGRGRPIVLKRWQVAALVAAAVVLFPLTANNYYLQTGTQVALYATLALSLTLVSGSAGQITLGQAGPLAVGAYTSALLVKEQHWPFLLAVLAGGVVAAVVSTVLASPTWRLRGHYVAIATIGIGAVITALILNWDSVTHGAMGVTMIPPPSPFGSDIVTPRGYFLLDVAVLLFTLLVVVRLRGSHLGRILSAVGADDLAVRSSGVRARDYKSLAFAIAAFFAGLAGALMGHQYSYLDPTMFNLNVSLLALTIIVLGGMTSPFGAILGSVVLVGAPEVLRMAQDLRIIFYGILLLLIIRFRPQGIWARA
ncbi:ABC transporter permease [Streptomyces sp.]|uniref:ABC transporter permease n=1 Tax=Streptomyces sp. TaxID=1931 RepID=UPI002F3EB3EA